MADIGLTNGDCAHDDAASGGRDQEDRDGSSDFEVDAELQRKFGLLSAPTPNAAIQSEFSSDPLAAEVTSLAAVNNESEDNGQPCSIPDDSSLTPISFHFHGIAPESPQVTAAGCLSGLDEQRVHELGRGAERPSKVVGVHGAGVDGGGENLQGPHNWRKRLKHIQCQVTTAAAENVVETKKEPKRETSEHILDRSGVKDRKLSSHDENFDDVKTKNDRTRTSPSGKKDTAMSRTTKGQASRNPLAARALKRGLSNLSSRSDSSFAESAFTRQVVKPMKSLALQRSRVLFPSSVAAKNSPPLIPGKKVAYPSHVDNFAGGGQVTKKMVEKVMKARLYLLQQTGPNSFLIGGDSPDHKYRVIIGSQKCSCGRESLCIHLLFVMLRVFQVSENDPLLSRRTLKNYEVEALFHNYHDRRTSKIKDNAKKKMNKLPESKKERAAEENADDEDNDDDEEEDEELTVAAEPDDDGIEKEEEELCSICLLEMVEGESLTECKTGCQNRLHHHCISVWFEECRRQKESLMCPLCRAEWKGEIGEASPAAAASSSSGAEEPTAIAMNARETLPPNRSNDVYAAPLDPVPPEHRETADKWIPVLGEEIVLRLFSKNWSVREIALRLLGQEAVRVLLLGVGEGRSGVLVSLERQANNHTMLDCCCAVLAFVLLDPVYKVFVAGLRALRMILSYTPCRDEQQKVRLQVLMKPVVKSLLLKCADSNRKTSQLSISALEELVKGPNGELAVGKEIVNPGNQDLGGVEYLVDCILEDDAIDNLQWQWILGRFCMLDRLLEVYHVDFTVASSSVRPEPDAADDAGSDERSERVFCVLRFCAGYMSFGHVKVSKMACRVFYCASHLQRRSESIVCKISALLDDVDPTIQTHMRRKLDAVLADRRDDPTRDDRRERPVAGETGSATISEASSPSMSGSTPGGSATMPNFDVAANVVTVVPSLPDHSRNSLERRDDCSHDRAQTARRENSSFCVATTSKPLESDDPAEPEPAKFADACVSTSPSLGADERGLWEASADGPGRIREPGSHQPGLVGFLPRPSTSRADDAERVARLLSKASSGFFNASSRSTSSEAVLLTDDLSDLILSPSGPEEKVSFKTEVATTPHGSPQRSADNTADNGCHCKEEVEKEEAEALVEALERSDLNQDALPHVPGLTRLKSNSAITIHMQDQTVCLSDTSGFDSTYEYQEGVHWKRGSILGTGAFSTCYQARDIRTGTLMACKQISFCRNTTSEQEKVVNAVKEEIHITGRLGHPNIIRILGATQQGCHFFMFVEWMPGCSIASLLDKYGSFSEQVITSYTLQVLRGLAYLHDNQVLHRDLKGANLLVDSTGHRVRIGDFGAAARLATRLTGAGEFEGQLLGTIAFMAPEVLRGDAYGRKCDIWSFGCVMVEMATALPPWGANDISNHLALIFKIASTVRPPPIPENLSPPVRDLLLRCLEVNPEDRPLAKDLLKHPLFRI